MTHYKKHYRDTNKSQRTTQQISVTLRKKILNKHSKLDDHIQAGKIKAILESKPFPDFNDALLYEQASLSKIKILTDDGDFGVFRDKIDILTSNSHLISQS